MLYIVSRIMILIQVYVIIINFIALLSVSYFQVANRNFNTNPHNAEYSYNLREQVCYLKN